MTARPLPPWLDRLAWRLTAPVYDRLARRLEPGRTWVATALDLSSDDRVLLLGCGTGLDLEHVPTDAPVVAVDRSRSMVRRCRRRGAELGVDLETRVGDARSVASPDRSFDAVFVHLLLSVAAEPDAVLAEASRLLTDGGRLSILDEPTRFTDEDSLRAAGLESHTTESFGEYTATIASRRARTSPPRD